MKTVCVPAEPETHKPLDLTAYGLILWVGMLFLALSIQYQSMDKIKILNNATYEILDGSNSISNRLWILTNSKLPESDVELIAMHTEFPTLSCAAFSMIENKHRISYILKRIFDAESKSNLEIITHEAIKGIASKEILWDLYVYKNTPRNLKPYIEDRINGTGTSIAPISDIIRTEKKSDESTWQ